MASSRRRSSGFTEKPAEEEIVETTIESVVEVEKEPEPAPFVEESIIPTALPEVQPAKETEPTVKTSSQPVPEVKKPGQQLSPPPKRHPRNIPKFSRHK